jgi:hypothetical protein
LGQSFYSGDKQGSNLDAISGSSSWIAESAFDPVSTSIHFAAIEPSDKTNALRLQVIGAVMSPSIANRNGLSGADRFIEILRDADQI